MHSAWVNIFSVVFGSACQLSLGYIIGSRPMWVLRQRKWEFLVVVLTLAPFAALVVVWRGDGFWWGALTFACMIVSTFQGLLSGAKTEAAGIIRKWLQERQRRKGSGGPWN